jgi:hypothetical protein
MDDRLPLRQRRDLQQRRLTTNQRSTPAALEAVFLMEKPMFKGKKSYDAELKKSGVVLDRAKPAPEPRELDVESIGTDPKLNASKFRRVTGRE